MELFESLAANISLILSLAFIYRLTVSQARFKHIAQNPVVRGILFGAFGVLSVMAALPVYPGYFLDGRLIIITVGGIFFGGLPALIAATLVSIAHLIIGSASTFPSIAAVYSAALLGWGVYWRRRSSQQPLNAVVLLMTGFIQVLIIAFWNIVLGGQDGYQALVIKSGPLLVQLPFGTLGVGWLFLYQERQIQLEARLVESEERFRTVVDNMNDGVVLFDHKGRVVVVNPSAEHILGLSREQLNGHTAIDHNWRTIREDGSHFPGEEYPISVALQTRVAQKNVVMGVYHPKDGLIWIKVNADPVMLGGNFAVLVTLTDISELRRTQEELKRERDLMRTVIDTSPDAILLKDTEGKVIFSNRAHIDIAAPSDGTMVGKTGFDLFSEETAEMIRQDDLSVLTSGKSLFNVEQTVINPKNEKRIVLTTKIPWYAPDGNIVGLLAIIRDITELKELETKAMELKTEQQRILAMQAFINDFSHDFRTPLSIIRSETYLLRKTSDEQKREKYLSAIEQQSARLLTYLDDFLEMARLDVEDFAPNAEMVDGNTIIQTIMHELSPIIHEKGLQLTHQLETQALPVQIDRVHFSRAVINLVQNAINYTPSGGSISIQTARVDEQMMLTITDTGIGISESDLPRVFERFYRADKARSAATGGSGLGLSIVRKIINAHQGSIHLESQVGMGTTVRVTLPLAHTAAT